MSAPSLDPGRGTFVVIAELMVKPDRLDEFVDLANAFASQCLALEPGCRQFQVVRLDAPATSVLFFEVYDDAAAFGLHTACAHLAAFKADFADLVVGEHALRLGRLSQQA